MTAMAVLPSGAPHKVMLACIVHEWVIVIGDAYYISDGRIAFGFCCHCSNSITNAGNKST